MSKGEPLAGPGEWHAGAEWGHVYTIDSMGIFDWKRG